MNAKKLIAVVAMLAGVGSAFAGEAATSEDNLNFRSTKTRAEVIAEFNQAKADGSYVAGGELYEGQPAKINASITSGKTRAEVRAELAQAQVDGTLVATGEVTPQAIKARAPANAGLRTSSQQGL